jgi:hypothetical protein
MPFALHISIDSISILMPIMTVTLLVDAVAYSTL